MPLLNVKGVNINFPFDPYPCQIDYMEKMIDCLQGNVNGILESPTGTGKTLCLLCSTLAWQQDKKACVQLNQQKSISDLIGDNAGKSDNFFKNISQTFEKSMGSSWGGNEFGVPKIIYASRTHSQLSQAIQELKRTAYNSVKVSVIGSREQLCIHEQVKKEISNTAKVHMCRAKVTARTCHYYNNLDALKKKGDVRHTTGAVVDIEDLMSLGTKQKVCPYYMARELKQDSDIIFMPYNYLLDPKSRKAHDIELQGNILIFDEAHNLEKICEESSSFDLSSTDIASAMEELTRVAEKLIDLVQEEKQAAEFAVDNAVVTEFDLSDVLRLKGTMKALEDQLDAVEIPKPAEGLTKNGMYIFELFAGASLNFETKTIVMDVMDKIAQYMASETGGAFHSKGTGLSKMVDILRIVFGREVRQGGSLHSHKEELAKSYKVHISDVDDSKKKKKTVDMWASTESSEKAVRKLSYWCFSPGHAMLDLVAHNVKCIVLTSGTLSPLQSFTTEMQIKFPVQLENPHVIEKHQVCIASLSTGPDGTVLNSNYQNRFNASYQASLGNAIVNFARCVPNGLLIFFPSYPVMNTCIEYWKENNIWDRISQYKPIFIEPKGKTEFQDAMDAFYEKINDETLNGAIFAAVCRGKVSEGLDFSDNNGRAVVITGLPFPPRMDPKIVLKMQYLDEMRFKEKNQNLSGRDWYRQQASRAVNQAIGRVIRHKQDYGAVLLCDTRFLSHDSLSQLPVWVRPHVNKYNKFGLAIRDLNVFFKTAEKLMPSVTPKVKIKANYGCQGASFEPSFSRSGPSLSQISKARNVDIHVPSLKPSEKENQTLLQSQYFGSQCQRDKPLKRSLLDALDKDESFEACERIIDSQIPSYQTSLDKKMEERKKIQAKKKIIVKKQPDECFSMPKPSLKQENLNYAAQYISEIKKVLGPDSYKIFSDALTDYKKREDYNKVTAILADLFTDEPKNHHFFRKFYKFIRPKHKADFDKLCKELTGEGCGYKVEDTVCKRKLSAESDLPDKKQKSHHTQLLPNSYDSSNQTSFDTQLCPPKQSNCQIKEDDVSSSKVILPKVIEKDDSRERQLSGDLFEDDNEKPSGTQTTHSQKGPLDIEYPKPQPNSGYICCKCNSGAVNPFRSACDHVCCMLCWKEVFESDKLCPKCKQRVRRRNMVRVYFWGPKTS